MSKGVDFVGRCLNCGKPVISTGGCECEPTFHGPAFADPEVVVLREEQDRLNRVLASIDAATDLNTARRRARIGRTGHTPK